MVLTIIDVPVLAEGNNVAKIGDTEYESLTGAINDVGNDETTITLLQSTNESITIPASKNITLDLNEKTLTNIAGEDTVTVDLGATLTITGNGVVDNITHAKAAIYNNGTTILKGGSYTRSREASTTTDNANGNSYYNILNHGQMTIEDGVSVTSTGAFSSLIDNGYYQYTNNDSRVGYVSDTGQEHPTLTINGGSFSGGINTVKNDDGAYLIVNGGTFENTTQTIIQNNNVATINDGIFVSNNEGCIHNRSWSAANNEGVLEINGGSFTGSTYVVRSTLEYGNGSTAKFTINDGIFNGPVKVDQDGLKLEISGGEYSADVSEYVVEDKLSIAVTASKNTTYYVGTKAENAVTSAKEGDTIVLVKGAELNNVPAGVTIENKTGSDIKVNGMEVKNENDITIHSYASAWTSDANNHWHACTVKGHTDVADKAVHTASDWKVVKEATTTSEGSKQKVCTICGKVLETTSIPKVTTPTTATDKPAATTATDKPVQPAVAKNQVVLPKVKASKTSNKLTWSKVKDADGYYVYAAKCNTKNKKYSLKKVKEIKSAKTVTYTHKKLKKNTWYKYQVAAYKKVNGKKVVIGKSLTLHSLTSGSKTYTNPSKVTVSKTTFSLKKGKTATIKAKMVLPKNKKTKNHVAKIRYVVSDKTICTVSANGKIKAKKKGTCTVYAVTQNGMSKKIKVTVK